MSVEIKKNGFTYIEVIIVFAIIGTLIVIAINGVKNSITYSHDQTNKQYLVSISQVLNSYYAENSAYPQVSCSGGGGPDGTSLLTAANGIGTLINNNGSSQTKADWNDVYNKISAEGAFNKYGYCSSPPLASNPTGASAYVIFLFTQTSQFCADINNKPYYAIGSGTFISGGINKVYDDIPVIYGVSQISTTPNYGIACYNK